MKSNKAMIDRFRQEAMEAEDPIIAFAAVAVTEKEGKRDCLVAMHGDATETIVGTEELLLRQIKEAGGDEDMAERLFGAVMRDLKELPPEDEDTVHWKGTVLKGVRKCLDQIGDEDGPLVGMALAIQNEKTTSGYGWGDTGTSIIDLVKAFASSLDEDVREEFFGDLLASLTTTEEEDE